MAKGEAKEPKTVSITLLPSEPMPPTGCFICGSYEGEFVPVTADARVHESCGAARPDLVARVKARA